MAKILRVEFHCHTGYSKDSLTRPADLLRVCRRKQIDRVVVTDHNVITGAQAARRMDPERVIVGLELMTREGELLAAFVRSPVPAGLPALEAIARLREQGSFISVSHPFDRSRRGHWHPDDLLAIRPHIDAIEVFNSRSLHPQANRSAQQFASAHRLPGTVGSDAHAGFEIGRALLELPAFADADGLRQVIAQGRSLTRLSSPLVRLVSRYAVLHKKLLGDPFRTRVDQADHS